MRFSALLRSAAGGLVVIILAGAAGPARAQDSVPVFLPQVGSGPPAAAPAPPEAIAAPEAIAPPEAGGPLPEQPALTVRRDAAGDLWVETPHYVWNVTGGRSIRTRGGAGEAEWPAAGGAESSVVDGLFLAAPAGGPTTSRVFYALPGEAVVYLERAVPAAGAGAAEGLELTFRAGDGLVRAAHRWQGPGAPAAGNVGALPVALPAGAQREAGVAGAGAARDGAGLAYVAGYDGAAGAGVALLAQARAGVAEEGEEGEEGGECYGAYPSREPQAHDPCFMRGIYLAGRTVGSDLLLFYGGEPVAPIERAAAALALALPDLNVAYIERLPRYDYSATPNEPAAGQLVTFRARIANRGGAASGPFQFIWRIDGVFAHGAPHGGLAPGQTGYLELPWAFVAGNHTVELTLDTYGVVAEVSEANNRVADRTNGLGLGLWVEQSVYDYFNAHQVELGLGGVSWDDWAQRQVALWNQLFAAAIHPLTPQGVVDRVRLDKVTIVPDGALPPDYPGNYPDTSDRTVDLMWGFVSELVGVAGSHPGTGPLYLDWTAAQLFEPPLLHELSHARYLIDLYGMNVALAATELADGVSAQSESLMVMGNVEGHSGFALPAYLAVEGELLICSAKWANFFYGCERGAEGTTARPHDAGAAVAQAAVRAQDGAGNLVMGSGALPLLPLWYDHLYYNRYPDDLMSNPGSDDLELGEHSAYAMNRIAGERPWCGNYNAPCNIGEYLDEIPAQNVVRVLGSNGAPVFGARVELFQARAGSAWYGKTYPAAPDRVLYTDRSGEADLGAFPFGPEPPIIHGYPHSDAVLLLRIAYDARTVYRFFEVTEANEAFWREETGRAVYAIETPFANECPAISGWKAEFWNNETRSGDPVLCRNDAAINFNWYGEPPDPRVNADNFAARWLTEADFAAGEYLFRLEHDDGARLLVDHAVVYENLCSGCVVEEEVRVSLGAGRHAVQYEVFEHEGWAKARLSWDASCRVLSLDAAPPPGGSVQASPAPDCGGIGYADGTRVTLTATAAEGFVFAGWAGDTWGSAPTVEVVMDRDRSVTAFFDACHRLTAVANPAQGGSVSASPAPNCGGLYRPGTAVGLMAQAKAGYVFRGWSGDASGTAPVAEVVMDGGRTVTAQFEAAGGGGKTFLPAVGR